MKKRIKLLVRMTLFVALIVLTLPTIANADTGPKPSVVINFIGPENEIYYVTLLSQAQSLGPWSARTSSTDYCPYTEDDEDYDVYLKFLNYEDSDGYYFLQYFSKCDDNGTYKWGYYPPSNFKILLYFPETDTFAVSSEAYERYAFDSYFKVDLSEYNYDSLIETQYISAVEGYDYAKEAFSLMSRIILTIAIEVVIAIWFSYRTGKQLIIIGTTNLVTQILLNVLLNIVKYQKDTFSFKLTYIALELLVFVIEAIVYYYCFKHYNKKEGTDKGQPILYAFIANAASFLVGLLLANIIPMIF